MNFDKRTILAFILIGILIILFQSSWYQKTFFPNTYKKAQEMKSRQRQMARTGAIDSLKENDIKPQEPIVKPAFEKARIDDTGLKLKVLSEEKEKRFTVDTPLYQATMSNIGARIGSFKLKQYLQEDSSFIELIQDDGFGNLSIIFNLENDSINTANFHFITDDSGAVLINDQDIHQIRYGIKFNNGLKIEKTYTFFANKYDIGFEVKLSHDENAAARPNYYFLTWDAGMAYSQYGPLGDGSFIKAYAHVGGKISPGYDLKSKVGEMAKIEKMGNENVHWAGQRTKYFSSVMIFDKKNAKQAIFSGYKKKVPEAPKEDIKVFSVRLEIPCFQNEQLAHVDNFNIFLGPLEYSLVKSYGIGLEEMMSWGISIIKPFSIAVLWSVKKLHQFIPNYGLVIIIFSIIVKILLHPLTHKSYVSMQAMQELQPKMNAIKEKYGNDQKRMNEEMMKLYKTEGINPLGGCLPMILQLPILYALFIIFRSTIELRAAQFVWWIKDLSMPDTIFTLGFNIPMYGDKVNVLPIIMGVTMLIQQKMSMKDPKQKAMVYLMPIFMTLLFNSFPSGLNLYYSLFNILSIIQQKFLTRPVKKKEDDTIKKKRI